MNDGDASAAEPLLPLVAACGVGRALVSPVQLSAGSKPGGHASERRPTIARGKGVAQRRTPPLVAVPILEAKPCKGDSDPSGGLRCWAQDGVVNFPPSSGCPRADVSHRMVVMAPTHKFPVMSIFDDVAPMVVQFIDIYLRRLQ